MKIKFKIVFLIWVLVLFAACSKDEADPQPASSVVVEAVSLTVRTASDLKNYIQLSGWDVDPTLIKHDVEIFRVKYKTTYKEGEVIASGILMLPQTSEEVGIISFQHGTIVAQADAPSAQSTLDVNMMLTSALASTGIITAFPDYVGFGSSSQIFHPYYVEEATPGPIIDNIRAAQEISQTHNLSLNGKLFLAGYSQGGYVTMATHKYIEENGQIEGLTLIASFPAAGGYDVKGIQQHFFEQESYNDPFYIAYVAKAYESYYGWENVIEDFFQSPYAERIPALFDGVHTPSQINAQLTNDISSLLQPDLVANIDNDEQYAYIADAFEENSLTDWTPTIPMHLYHGSADITVPYQNSVDTYNTLLQNGASAEVVTFTRLEGATHSSGLEPYVKDFLPKLMALK